MLYPNNIKKEYKHNISHKNRGMDLEALINETNKYYIDQDIALIYKKPTPIGVVKVSYENKHKIIKKGYFSSPSTLDYNGIYKGKYLDFEAKETQNRTSFPLKNIHPHQIEHLRSVIRHNGISFLIIKINSYIYLLDGNDFLNYIDNKKRASIEYDYIKNKGHIIKETFIPKLDYIKVVEEIYFKESENSDEKK